MSKIPKIIQGDISTDLKKWISQFERHLRALEIENDKSSDILYSCLEGTALSHLCSLRVANANITYVQVKNEFVQRFCRDEYKRNLPIKSQNFEFMKGTLINSFATDAKSFIRNPAA